MEGRACGISPSCFIHDGIRGRSFLEIATIPRMQFDRGEFRRQSWRKNLFSVFFIMRTTATRFENNPITMIDRE